MQINFQESVCTFAREIISSRTGETIEPTERPDQQKQNRNVRSPDESRASPSRRYVVEHTRLESYEGQIDNHEKLQRLLLPVRQLLAGMLPGTFVLTVRTRETAIARVKYGIARFRSSG